MNLNVYESPASAAAAAAALMAEELRAAVAERGCALVAVSGGRSPWLMLRELAGIELPWERVHLFQTDERIAPAGSPERNLTHIRETLLDRVPLPVHQVHAMPVGAPDPEAAAAQYGDALRRVAGTPPVLDLVHLGLGPDGHTASLVPGDPVLNVTDRDAAVTGNYQDRRRMTLTYPVLNRARRILWLVTGSDKAAMLERLRRGDTSIPAGRVSRQQAVIIADRAAAGEEEQS